MQIKVRFKGCTMELDIGDVNDLQCQLSGILKDETIKASLMLFGKATDHYVFTFYRHWVREMDIDKNGHRIDGYVDDLPPFLPDDQLIDYLSFKISDVHVANSLITDTQLIDLIYEKLGVEKATIDLDQFTLVKPTYVVIAHNSRPVRHWWKAEVLEALSEAVRVVDETFITIKPTKKVKKYPIDPLEIKTSKFTPEEIVFSNPEGFVIARGSWADAGEYRYACRYHTPEEVGYPCYQGSSQWMLLPATGIDLTDRFTTLRFYNQKELPEVGSIIRSGPDKFLVTGHAEHLHTVYVKGYNNVKETLGSHEIDSVLIRSDVESPLTKFHKHHCFLWVGMDDRLRVSVPTAVQNVYEIHDITIGFTTNQYGHNYIQESARFMGWTHSLQSLALIGKWDFEDNTTHSVLCEKLGEQIEMAKSRMNESKSLFDKNSVMLTTGVGIHDPFNLLD